jgi:hypothetical protein
MIERLNNSKVTTYSQTLNLNVTFLLTGSSYSYKQLKGYTINTNPITNVDLSSLPDGLIALKADKVTQFNIFKSVSHAAYLIDNNFESEYIKRYVNVEKLIKTTAGSFYFVQRPDYIAPKFQFRDNLKKGVKISIFLYDPRYNVYVQFKSKAEVSEYL